MDDLIIPRSNGRYDVMSESGRRLGKNLSKSKAEKRLAMVEWFKRRDEKRRINRKA